MTTVTKIPAGELADGGEAHRYIIDNGHIEVCLLDLGVRATSIRLAGLPHNLLLAYPSLIDYERDTASMGAVVGRYANRIRDGRFPLNGKSIQLSINRDSYHLHGGFKGFACRLWQGEPIEAGVRFSLESADGEEGYPGNLRVTLEVRLDDDTLEYRYAARADADTIINLSNHSYFNLDGTSDILRHRLQLMADSYLPIDEEILPTGEVVPVAGSVFDFRDPKALGRDIDAADEQLRRGSGYDHCFVLRHAGRDDQPALAARLLGDRAAMNLFTSEPAVQLYTGNQLPQVRQGLCLETQHFPDSPNHPGFPTTLLRAGAPYSSITRYQFKAV